MRHKSKKCGGKRKLGAVLILLFIFAIIISTLCIAFVDNKTVDFENFSINKSEVSTDGTEIKIVHLSDLHFPRIKVNLDNLVAKIKDENADFIAITGDIIDSKVNKSGVFEFIDLIKDVAPIFYVQGNHEKRSRDEKDLYTYLESANITVLRNESVNFSAKGKQITIIGLLDNADYLSSCYENNTEAENNFVVLLAHRPDKFKNYISPENSVIPDLILSGHIHGGQFRFFGKGLLSPAIRFFPKYDNGMYVSDNSKNSSLLVSRGIGNSSIPLRFNNLPHVPIITVTLP